MTKVKEYTLYVSDSSDSLDINYLYSLKDLKNTLNTGKYIVRKSQTNRSAGYEEIKKEEVSIEYSKDQIKYIPNEPDKTFDNFIISTIDTEYFKKLKVRSYLLKHPETELKDITYELPNNSILIKKLKEKFAITDVEKAEITFSKNGKNDFDYTIRIKTKNKKYYLGETYSFRK